MANGDQGRPGLSRRSLIKGAAAAAGGAALGSTATANAAPESAAPAEGRPSHERQTGELALVNGRILTLDDKNTVASSLVIRDGRIASVGHSAGRAERTIDLRGATVIPGLIDSHNHIYWAFSNPGHEARGVELATSIRELQQAIAQRARTAPAGGFVTCNGGWNRNGVAEKRLPTLAELDAAAPKHPVWIAETQTEAAWIDPENNPPLPGVTNTLGMKFFNDRGVAADPRTGLIPWVESSAALQAAQTPEERQRSLTDAIDYAVGLGVTTILDFGDSLAPDGSLESAYPYVIDLWRQEQLKLRFRLRLDAPTNDIAGLQARMVNSINRLGDDVLRLNGFGEGLPGRLTEQFVESAKAVASGGWSATVHSVSVGEPGDTTQNQFHIAAYQAANAVRPLRDLRWSLAHVNYITRDLVQPLLDMGVGVTAEGWQYYGSPLEPVPMGPPWRMLLDAGLPVGGGSDGTGTAGFNPWPIIYYMTTGRINTGEVGNAGQTVSRLEALKIYTKGSAWHSFDDDHLGSLEPGKLADLAVLSDNPLTVSDDKLRRIQSVLTLQAGKTVHEMTPPRRRA